MDMKECMEALKVMEKNASKNIVSPLMLVQHTNKMFLLENHKAGMDNITRTFTSGRSLAHQTVTPNLKFLKAVPLDAENRIVIKDLFKSINEPFEGKFLLCRTLCPPCKMTALMSIVDDPDGHLAVKILLYNFVPIVSHMSHEDCYPHLPVGSIIAIMNPWFKATGEGGMAVRCDNPSHVVRLNSSKFDHIIAGLTWNGQIPEEFQKYEPDKPGKTSAVDWKKMGNEHFASKRYFESVTAYTNGIDAHNRSKVFLDLLSNRSAAYLKLGNFKLALADAQSVLDVDKTNTKCILWRANALFGLARYDEAVSFLNQDISQDNQKSIEDLIVKGKRFSAQSRTGEYPWNDILANQLPDYCHDIAEYRGTVVVKDSPNKGRGLFASETIKSGQLILASKAFANVVIRDPEGPYLNSKNTKYLTSRSQTELVTAIAQILTNCPEKCAEFYSLYGGVEYSNEKSREDLQVDVKRIGDICHYNGFGYGGSFYFSGASKNDVSGIWILPSFINHSCVDANCSWIQNGNFTFVRAFHDIPKGEEILIGYLPPFASVTQKKLQKYEFTCDCRLCKRDRLDAPKTQELRSGLESRLAKIFQKVGTEKLDLDDRENAEVKIIFNLLKESRTDAPELNIFFLQEVHTMALLYSRKGLHLKCVETLKGVFNACENLATLCHFTLTTIANIAVSYLEMGDKDTASTWFEIFKRRAEIYYGSADAIRIHFANSQTLLKKFGLY